MNEEFVTLCVMDGPRVESGENDGREGCIRTSGASAWAVIAFARSCRGSFMPCMLRILAVAQLQLIRRRADVSRQGAEAQRELR